MAEAASASVLNTADFLIVEWSIDASSLNVQEGGGGLWIESLGISIVYI